MADEKHLNEPAIVGPASVPVIVAIPAHIAQALGITNGSLIDIDYVSEVQNISNCEADGPCYDEETPGILITKRDE